MSFFKEENIGKLILLNSAIPLVLLGLVMLLHAILDLSNYYKLEISQVEQEFIEEKKTTVKKLVQYQIYRLNMRQKQTTELLKNSLQQHVLQASKIAAHIYEQDHEDLSQNELYARITETLRFHTSNHGKGYLFMWKMDGTCLLYPPQPQWEGQHNTAIADNRLNTVFTTLKNIITTQGEGFYTYQWPKHPGTSGKTFAKISYVSYFEPLDCFIASGVYLDDITQGVKQLIVNILNKRDNQHLFTDYFYILDLHNINGGEDFATMLVNPNNPELIGTMYSSQDKDAKGQKFIEKYLQDLRENGEAFVQCWDRQPGSTEPKQKMTYLKFYPKWNWVIAQGFYFDDLNSLITSKKEVLKQDVRQEFFHSFYILLFFLTITTILCFFFSKKINSLFETYRHHLEESNQSLAREATLRTYAQEKLSESYMTLDQIFNIASSGMVQISTEYKIEMVNDTFIKMIGLPEGEIINRNCYDVLQSDLCHTDQCPLKTLAQGSEKIQFNLEPEMHRMQIPAILTSVPMHHNDGEFIGIIEDFYDLSKITEKEQELLDSREQFSLALQGANLGLWDWYPQSNTLITNDIFLTMLGYSPDAFPQTLERWSSLVHPEDIGRVQTILQPFLDWDDHTYRSEHRMRTSDGQWRWILDVGRVVKRDSAGKAVRFLGVHIDITEKKQTEHQLIKAQHQAEAASLAKSEFLANMSHEIRTPMNGIIGMIRLALDTELTPKQQQYLENVKFSADGLLGLLNDILDFSKIEAGQLVMEEYDFNLLHTLEHVIAMMGFTAKEKGLTLRLEKDALIQPVFVLGDELRLRQILVNLIGNALKFTPHGTVTLRVLSQNRTDQKVDLHFMVIDTGIGISVDKQDTIFQNFSQADSSTTREFGGTGLGLAISKQLVEMMNGRIWIESTEGQGTTFHFTIALKQGDEDQVPTQKKEDLHVHGLDILLVDDNKINCDLACIVLEQDGHRIVTAENGLEALKKIADQHFDLILMDVQMPVMDGLTATTIIRASETGEELTGFNLPPALTEKLATHCRGKDIPIIAMTANAMSGDREKCLVAGMSDYLTKPFKPQQVRAILSKSVKSPQKNDQSA